MLIKVRYPVGASGKRIMGKRAPVASGAAGLIILLAVSCLMLALWRLTSDLGWTGEFVVSDGFLSHWQVWMALTIVFGAIGVRLSRYSRTTEAALVAASDSARASGRPQAQ